LRNSRNWSLYRFTIWSHITVPRPTLSHLPTSLVDQPRSYASDGVFDDSVRSECEEQGTEFGLGRGDGWTDGSASSTRTNVAAATKDRSKEGDRSHAADGSTESERASVAGLHTSVPEQIDGLEAKSSESERKPLPLITEVGDQPRKRRKSSNSWASARARVRVIEQKPSSGGRLMAGLALNESERIPALPSWPGEPKCRLCRLKDQSPLSGVSRSRRMARSILRSSPKRITSQRNRRRRLRPGWSRGVERQIIGRRRRTLRHGRGRRRFGRLSGRRRNRRRGSPSTERSQAGRYTETLRRSRGRQRLRRLRGRRRK
jgi:hypothetical protein